MKTIDWFAVGKLDIVLIVAALGLWRLPLDSSMLMIAGLLLYTYLSMQWCCPQHR